jgi:hypothetical protein
MSLQWNGNGRKRASVDAEAFHRQRMPEIATAVLRSQTRIPRRPYPARVSAFLLESMPSLPPQY